MKELPKHTKKNSHNFKPNIRQTNNNGIRKNHKNLCQERSNIIFGCFSKPVALQKVKWYSLRPGKKSRDQPREYLYNSFYIRMNQHIIVVRIMVKLLSSSFHINLSFQDELKFIVVLQQVVLNSNHASTPTLIKKLKIPNVEPPLSEGKLGPTKSVRIMINSVFGWEGSTGKGKVKGMKIWEDLMDLVCISLKGEREGGRKCQFI